MRIAFIGPVGTGKTAQAQRLARELPHYNPRVSTGELVRAHIEARTELGHRMRGYHDRGEAVPDELLLPLILPRVRREHGWILDNFPASMAQAGALEAELRGRQAGYLSRVVALEGPSDEELVERILSGRVHSRATGRVYHLSNDPPRPEDNLDPGPFERREDDTEEALGRRLEASRREYGALKEHYEARGLLSVVDARGSLGEVSDEVLEELGHPELPEFYVLGR